MKKVILTAGLVAVAAVGCGIAFLALTTPKMRAAADIKVPMTPERMERGRYLYEHVAHCDGCHSPRDWTKLTAPTIEQTRGSGFEFPAELGFPGRIVSANITQIQTPPRPMDRWEKIRAEPRGVSKDGRCLFPQMPYRRSHMTTSVESLDAFMNTLKPVRSSACEDRTELSVKLLSVHAETLRRENANRQE